MLKPDEITYLTKLDSQYVSELKDIATPDKFEEFIKKWNYWLDNDCKNLKGDDWPKLKPLIADCLKNNVTYTEKHNVAAKLCLPEKLFFIGMIALQFNVPWGCAYIRAKEEKIIDY